MNHYPHFAYEETEAQRGYITCSRVGKGWNWGSHSSSQPQRVCPESTALQATGHTKQVGVHCWSALFTWGDQGLSSCLQNQGWRASDDRMRLLKQPAGPSTEAHSGHNLRVLDPICLAQNISSLLGGLVVRPR